ncbi:diguanylate cyclase [Ferrimicrobium sp.]|uniref:diguanylate cyclase domain-containing protein n=1 Tax=Ferrimicrobium sp. TaxID=2926050 RepID=UPI002636C55D|nr:diguanylate cyclase [Ferrimicrobium sp.]
MGTELVIIIVLAVVLVAGVGYGLQRSANGRHLQRNNQLQQLLAQASQLIHDSPDEAQFLQKVCGLICQMPPVRLAWIGRPDGNGTVRPIASCGDVSYLSKVQVSIRGDSPAGQGPVGHAWRSGTALYDDHALRNPDYEPWRSAAKAHQLVGVHALPIRCQGELDAILVVYFGRKPILDYDERLLLERLANDLATGITKIREHQHNHRLAAALAQISEAVFIVDLDGRITWFNDGLVDLFAMNREEIHGSHPTILLGDPHFDQLLEQSKHLAEDEELPDWEILQQTAVGVTRWVHVSATPLVDDLHTISGVVVVEIDLTDERAAVDAERRLLAILDDTSDGVGITDRNGRIIYLNNGGRQLVGLDVDTPAEGRHFFELIGDTVGQEHFSIAVQRAAELGRWEGELSIKRPDGVQVPLSMVLMVHRNTAGHVQYISAIARNMVDQKLRESELSYLADHDALTGLPNRRVLNASLDAAIVLARQTGHHFAVGVIDLDDFKPVNDRLGHHAGDELLVGLAKRLRHLIREGDTIIRLGGDEFLVILNALDPSQGGNDLEIVLERMHEAVVTPFVLGQDHQVTVDMSIGIATFPDTSTEPDALMREADAALYIAKQRKRHRSRWWRLASDPEIEAEELQPVALTSSAYGVEAGMMLAALVSETPELVTNAVTAFYGAVEASPLGASILAHLSESEYRVLKHHQAAHLESLLDGNLEKRALEHQAEQVGTAHALAGLLAADLVDSVNSYRSALTEQINRLPINPRVIKDIVGIINRRVDDDIAAQLRALSATTDTYFNIFAQPLPGVDGLWIDSIQAELDMVGQLPGIAAIGLARQGGGDSLLIEAYAGRGGQRLAEQMNSPGAQVAIDPHHRNGQMLCSRAWRDARILVTDRIADDTIYGSWPSNEGVALRSAVAIPIQNVEGRPVALLLLTGNYPGQFSSAWMDRFNRNLKQRWENLLYRIATPDNVLARQQAIGYRGLLLSGGLRMFVQPIVDLNTGQPVKVEGLARLVEPDGNIIAPDRFLSILGAGERYHLFRMGLELLFAAERQWRASGLLIDLTINVDAATLNYPELPSWLATTLMKWDFPPHRLVLELLETDRQHLMPDSKRLGELLNLGVQLAIDDMGSGYSNWLRLVEIPATLIKIDHHFTARLETHPTRVLNLLGTLILTATDAGQKVVVEGIEDPVLAEVAARLGADFGQGYGIAKPMPTDQLIHWSRSYHHEHSSHELRSLLGAMAYHWAFVHSPMHYNRGPLANCLLTGYFVAHDLDTSEGADLHRALHAHATPPADLVNALTRWFERECSPNGSSRNVLAKPTPSPSPGDDWAWMI